MKLLHLSDLHFHHDDKNNRTLLKRIKALEKYPDHIKIITGDIVDDGRPDQREKARKQLDQLGSVYLVPGNHDYGAFGTGYNVEDAKAFDDFSFTPFFKKIPFAIRIERENLLFILLNSCLKTKSPFDFACGKIGVGQIGLLTKILDDPDNKCFIKVVALHHHPFYHSDPGMRLLDANLFMRAIYGKVNILMFGHQHEEGYWHDKSGCKEMLAAGALYEATTIKEVVIEGCEIKVNKIKLV